MWNEMSNKIRKVARERRITKKILTESKGYRLQGKET